MVRTDPTRGFQFVSEMDECPGCEELAAELRPVPSAGPTGLRLCDDCLSAWQRERQRDRRLAGRPGR